MPIHFTSRHTHLLLLLLTVFTFACQPNNNKKDPATEVDTPFVIQNPYQYTIDIATLGKVNLKFDFNYEWGAEGTMISDNNRHRFRVHPVMPVGNYLSLKIISEGFQTNDLTYYDYLINFQYQNLGKSSFEVSLYDKETRVEQTVLMSKR